MTHRVYDHVRDLAVTTLDDNWRHDHTVPSRMLYPHQWSWDTAFIAIGLAQVAPPRAWHDLRSLFEGQWSDGRLPHIVFDQNNGERDYFPGPGFWGSTGIPGAPARPTSGIVQPPAHALAAWELYRRAGDPTARAAATTELRWLYPKLVAQQQYLATRRNIGGSGLACLVHPWESGQDNSPAWDKPLAAVPANTTILDRHRRRDLAVAHRSHRPTDADYARYISIAQGYRSYGYVDDGPGGRYQFLVECPAFNAIMAAAEHALARIADVVGADPAPHHHQAARITETLVARLFDPDTGMFHARDIYTDHLSPARTIGGLVPLILPGLPRPQVESVVAAATSRQFELGGSSGLPLASYDRTAADLDPVRYWRGPIWLNMNWLLWRGLRAHGYATLADGLRHAMIDLVDRSGCFEYFHAITGEGVGAAEFSWTAALALDLLAEPPEPDDTGPGDRNTSSPIRLDGGATR
jgi:hypothetical protein